MIDLDTLRRIVEHTPASVMVTDPKGDIQYVNPYFERLTGYSAAEVIGQNPRVLQAGLQTREFYEDLWHTILGGQEWRGELANRRKSGELFWERASISPVFDRTGALTHFVAVKQDITAERAEQEEHRRNEERFDLAMRGSNDGLWDWDLSSNTVVYSPRWKSMLGYDEDEVEPSIKAFEHLVHPCDLPRAMSAVRGYLNGTTDRYEIMLRMRHKAGHYLEVLARGYAARHASGTAYRLVGTHTDVSEQQHIEHLLAAQSAATQVLATATTLMETLPRLLAAIGESGLWAAGCVWGVDASAERLRCLALWHAADVAPGRWAHALRLQPVEQGVGAAGQAWWRGTPIWIEDESADCSTVPAADFGMCGTFAVPINFDGRIVAVVQFWAREIRPRDERWFRMFDQLHTLAVQIVERRRSERTTETAM
jgi:PAS domain S-box-containing protein